MSPRAAWRLESIGFAEVYDYVDGKVDWGAAGLPREGTAMAHQSAGDAAENAPTCVLDDPVSTVRERFASTGWDTCVVINDQGVVLGRLGRRAFGEATGRAEDAMTSGPSTVRPSLPLDVLTERMTRQNLTNVIVTTSDGRLVGIVRRHS